MIKGKNGFWLLMIIFSVIIIMVVLNGENYGMQISKEMGNTMGFMMKMNHASLATINDVLSAEWSYKSDSMMSGNHPLPWFIKSLDMAGSSAILMILPLMIGASALMIILWL